MLQRPPERPPGAAFADDLGLEFVGGGKETGERQPGALGGRAQRSEVGLDLGNRAGAHHVAMLAPIW